jgi:hypothetical protein
MDILICGDEAYIEPWDEPQNTVGNWNRARSFKSHDNSVNSIEQTQLAYPEVWFRYTLNQPAGTSTTGLTELSFNNETTYPL